VGAFVENDGGFVGESVDGVLVGLAVGESVGESVDGALVESESLFPPLGAFFSIRTSSSMRFLGALVAFGSLLPFGILEDFDPFFNTRAALNDVAQATLSVAMIQRRADRITMEIRWWNMIQSMVGSQILVKGSILVRSEDYESDGCINSDFMCLETENDRGKDETEYNHWI